MLVWFLHSSTSYARVMHSRYSILCRAWCDGQVNAHDNLKYVASQWCWRASGLRLLLLLLLLLLLRQPCLLGLTPHPY